MKTKSYVLILPVGFLKTPYSRAMRLERDPNNSILLINILQRYNPSEIVFLTDEFLGYEKKAEVIANSFSGIINLEDILEKNIITFPYSTDNILRWRQANSQNTNVTYLIIRDNTKHVYTLNHAFPEIADQVFNMNIDSIEGYVRATDIGILMNAAL